MFIRASLLKPVPLGKGQKQHKDSKTSVFSGRIAVSAGVSGLRSARAAIASALAAAAASALASAILAALAAAAFLAFSSFSFPAAIAATVSGLSIFGFLLGLAEESSRACTAG